jgi:hypothetical protein
MKCFIIFVLLVSSFSTFATSEVYVKQSIQNWKLEELNTYLELNSKLVSKITAKQALQDLNMEYTKNPSIINTELNQRLRNIAF